MERSAMQIHFHEIPENIIDRIVAEGEVLYCAGAPTCLTSCLAAGNSQIYIRA